jgi:deoxyribonuclease V
VNRAGERRRAHEQRLLNWHAPAAPLVGGCFVCFPRGPTGPGAAGDRAWAAAAKLRVATGPRGADESRAAAAGAASGGADQSRAVVEGAAGAPYEAGLLALREGPLLEAAVRALAAVPDVLLVDATGADHPRRAGLALHLGAVLDLPTVGVTHRLLVAEGHWPRDPARGAESELRIGDEEVGLWVRTRRGARPLAVHPGWRVDAPTARAVVLGCVGRARTPEPLRRARQLARLARAGRL